jgi:hypothetical protein
VSGADQKPTVGRWTPGEEYAGFLRVELDFESQTGFVYINGKKCDKDLPISDKSFKPHYWGGKSFRLDRWAFHAPGSPRSDPHKEYYPRYADIDDLEFGTWSYRGAQTQLTNESSTP